MTAVDTPADAADKPWFFLGQGFYAGGSPGFFDCTETEATKLLTQHYEEIKAEVEGFYNVRRDEFRTNFVPYALDMTGWKTLNLYSYFFQRRQNRRRFPTLDAVVRQIPGMALCQVAVLEPNTVVRGHFGDSNIVMRHHLGLVIPAGLPDVGIRVEREDKAWKEGEVFAILIARRHKAWNLTDQHRIIVVVDVIRPEFYEDRYQLAAMAMASVLMKLIATKLPGTKRWSRRRLDKLQRAIAPAFRLLVWTQRVQDRLFPVRETAEAEQRLRARSESPRQTTPTPV
jgi:hypothetical protein